MNAGRSGISLAVWLGLWGCLWWLPGLGAAYWLLVGFRVPTTGVWQHAALMAALWLLALLPIASDLLLGRLSNRQIGWSAALFATLHALFAAFYVLSAIGLEFWGGWINTPLIAAYAPQVFALLKVLEIPSTAVLLGVAAAWGVLFACHQVLLRRVVAARQAIDVDVGPATGVALLTGMVASLMLFYWSYTANTDFWWREPVRQAELNAGFGSAGEGQLFTPERLRREREAIAAYKPATPRKPLRPLILVIVDALRSDLMGVYGGPVDNTPFLSELHRTGRLRRIDDAYSVCTVSYCGILGILSSKYWFQITPQPWNIADALKPFGYRSRFILSGDHTSYFGLRRMFGEAVDLVHDARDQSTRYSNDDRLVFDQIDRLDWPPRQPVFLYVHLMSAHRLGLIEDANRRWDEGSAPVWSRYEKLETQYNGTRARYHNGILQADAKLRELFERLKRIGLLDDALIVITADHGDMMGELGLWSHAQPPYEPVVRVPLLVYDAKDRTPYPRRAMTSVVDVAPTLLEAIGAQTPAGWSGIALQRPAQRDVIGIESGKVSGVVVQLGARRFKYWKEVPGGTEHLFKLRDSGGGEGVDLATDPRFERTLVEMRGRHQRFLAEH